jgi:hypothetical protein
MLHRLDFVQFHDLVPYAAFGFTAAVFFFVVYRALRMKAHRAEHLAALPVDDEPTDPERKP